MKTKLTLLLMVVLTASAGAQVVPPDRLVAGRTIPEWSVEWWKWILSTPVAENADFDYTGDKLLVGQPPNRPVIFLSQQIEPHDPFTRTATIEEGAYLLFPIIPFFNNAFGEDPWGSVSEQQRDASIEYTALTSELGASLDGTTLTNLFYTSGQRVTNFLAHRTLAPEFSVWMPPADNVYQYFGLDVAGVFDPCYADGFWVMLAPLSLGEHELKFNSAASVSQVNDVAFHLTVRELDLPRAVSALLPTLAAAGLPNKRLEILRARLVAAERFFNAQNLHAGLHELERFQHEVHVHVQPHNEPVASELYYASERILIAGKRRLGITPPPSPFETAATIPQSTVPSKPSPSPAPLLPSTFLREDFWLPDGPVHSILATNGLVYLGGSFNSLSRPNAPTAGGFDVFSASVDPDFPAINGAVHRIIADGQGGFYVGGEFSIVGGLPRANLARVRPDRMVDSDWRADTDGAVLALALSTNMLYVGGSFSTIAGVPRAYLAAIDPSTAAVSDWNPGVSASAIKPNPVGVRALALADGLLYVAGAFSAVGDADRENLAAIDPQTGQATDWHPIIFNLPENTQVIDALLISGDSAYVGSSFIRSINSVPRNFAAAFDLGRAADNLLPWNPDVAGPVLALAASCDTVYLGGSFAAVGGQPRASLAAVDTVLGTTASWNPGADGVVQTFALSGNTLYAGGQFTRVNGHQRANLARIDTSSGAVDNWDARPRFTVSTILLSGNSVLAGGGAVGIARKNLAALDAMTGKPTAWDPSPDGAIYGLAMSGQNLYIGGDFLNVAGQARSRLAALDSESGAALDWAPDISGFERGNAVVESVLVSSKAVYVSGSFTNLNGQTRLHLAALDPLTGQLLTWNPGANGDVRTLRMAGNTIYAGGRFTEISGRFRRRLAAIDADTGSVLAWNPATDDAVRALEIMGRSVIAGGLFSNVQNMRRAGLARVEAIRGLLEAWRPQAVNTNFIGPYQKTSYVNAISPISGVAFVGGLFNHIGDQPRNNLAALDLINGRALDWSADADQPVITTAYAEGTLYVGGNFRTIAGEFHPGFAVFPPLGAPRIVRHPPSLRVQVGEPISLEAKAAGRAPLRYQWQLNGANIPGATSPTLSVASAAISDSGEYILVVSNAVGVVGSRPGIVTVIEPLKIVTQPISQTVLPGSLVTLAVTVTGHPSPAYQWRLNGVNIPGAISSSFTIANAQSTNGGSYQVVLANLGGALSSETATVMVSSPALPLADNLDGRSTIASSSGVGSGSNVGATREPGEPNHAGKVSGKSVWLGWRAPASGIATFSTRGSGFDTLLGIYTGTDLASLTNVTSDDDRGGFAASQASFNAVAGTEYLIAIDGFAGASGNIVLSWNLDTTTVPFPRIINQPLSQTVFRNGDATFFVDVTSPSPVTYQWFFGCRQIEGATNASLTILHPQPTDVGNYRVFVMNGSSKIAESLDAFLELGPVAKVFSHDKLEDLLNAGLQSAFTAPERSAGGSTLQRFNALTIQPLNASGASGFISVSVGTIDSQVLNNTGATTQQGEPSPCGVIGGSSKWFGLQPVGDGMMLIDTIGSAIDTVMAVYTGTNLFTLQLVGCDNNSASDGIRSLVRFPATTGVKYAVAVDGVNGAQGVINLNWKLGRAPKRIAPPSNLTIIRGGSATLDSSLPADTLPPINYQWLLNEKVLAGANKATLTVTNAQAAQTGIYTLIASNFAGVVTNTVAIIKVGTPIQLGSGWVHTNGQTLFRLTGPSSQGFTIQASSNLMNWIDLYTNSAASAAIDFQDPQTPVNSRRFYRVVPWP